MRSLRTGDVSWLAWRAGAPLLAVFLGLTAYAGWLYARGHTAFERRRLEQLQGLSGEQKTLREALSAVNRRIAGLQADLAAQDERRGLADRAVATLRADDSWWRTAWAKLFGDSTALHTEAEMVARLEQARSEAAARGAELRRAITRATWERDGAEIALGRIERRLAAAERARPDMSYYLGRAWAKLRWYFLAALALWFLGLVLWRRGWSQSGNSEATKP